MVESVKAKVERSIFSIKKGTILSDLIPSLKLPHEPLFAKIDEQIVERKSSPSPFSFDILLKNNWCQKIIGKIIGARPHFYSKIKKWKEIENGAWHQLFLRYGDSVDLQRL
ncbi:MAG: hypothetical protein GQ476_04325 [Candidatus Aminicenantes bacterium]|nr:hypothetical protein [Candidatus Aminicenantes bacterium]